MATGLEITIRVAGIILVVVGVGVAVWGYQLSDSLSSQVTQAVTGSDTDRVMTFYIAGAASFVVGLYLLAKR